jgi:hypothetical protein
MDPKSVPSKLIESAPVGPLSPYIESYVTLVNEQGFAPSSVYEQIRVIVMFNQSFERDALHCKPERARPLAQSVREKTGGNPFFAIQFFTALPEEGLLAFDPATPAWQWDNGPNHDIWRSQGSQLGLHPLDLARNASPPNHRSTRLARVSPSRRAFKQGL